MADAEIDATGKYVLPGGIDAHTHMEMPFGGTPSVDTFDTGTTAAAWGGTTTIIDFAVQAKGTSLLSTLDKWHEKADGNCAIDYGFHMIVSDVNDQSLKEMESCIDGGVNSFKMFMAYPGVFYSTDGEILRAMQKAAETGAMIMMHAENGIAIDELVAQAFAAGQTDPVQHGLTRPPELEGEATSRAIQLAEVTGAPLYIVHLSARASAGGRRAGARHRAERVRRDLPAVPVPVHRGPGEAGLRGREVRRLAAAAAQGAPGRPVARAAHQRPVRGVAPTTARSASRTRRSWAAATSPRSRTACPASSTGWTCCTRAWWPGRSRWPAGWRSASTTPARMFGLYPRKGVIAPGADADIVVYDPAAKQTLSVETHHMNVDYSAYEGMRDHRQGRDGAVARVGGRLADGAFHGATGHGQFL